MGLAALDRQLDFVAALSGNMLEAERLRGAVNFRFPIS
jgi:hypothetical protein